MVHNYGLTDDSITRAKCTPDQEIVITGMAGRFPNSHNIKEFEYNLYNKVDLCDDDERRWRHEYRDIPKRSGKTYNLEKFDSTFFRINKKQADALDPQMRGLMEHAYESIIDAGINPYELRGSKTGVFIGALYTETESALFYDSTLSESGYLLTGMGRAMFANRLSYSMDLQGPSCLLDTACSSSLYALNAAFNAIRSGECEAAIVGATNITLHPNISLNFSRLGVIAKDGISRPFDDDASGYVRAEALGCLFLQKAKDAKRIYGTVVYSKTNCDGFKLENITYPSGEIQAKLYDEFYKDIGINPNGVAFVEAHSTGTIVGDPEECVAIDSIFCKNRIKPLPIGSTKSNMGHAESAAGICSLIKCIFALENKLIPPNINFKKYRKGIESFEKNRLQVVTDPQPLDGELIAVNSFGFGGANGHCLLRNHSKDKINDGRPLDKLPRLVNWAGRTEEACNAILDDITSRYLDAEYIGLIHNTQKYSTSGNVYRSFGVFSDEENATAKCLARETQHFSGIKPKIVFVFSGMGSQWCEMGTKLLEIPLFKKSIQKCHEILVPKGLNLLKILTSSDKTMFDNVVHSFVGIAAIQIGICDVLEEIGICPDLIVGHSVGELGCAYADKCLTAQEMILCAYSRGLATIQTDTIYGAMAAVGLGFQQIKTLLPDTIDVACHNSSNSSTISGPKEEVEKFVAELKAKEIFAKEVPAANRAFHSRYISAMGPKLMAYLKQVISSPKERSAKWLSSSVPKDKWELPESQLCSAEYQTNNLLSPVLFEETIAQLPTNSVTIEIAPHGLLQAILKKSLVNCVNIPLTQRDNTDNHIFFLSALGKLYQTGIDMSIEKLYPKVNFPVSRGTPRLSHLIKWNHKDDLYVMNFNTNSVKTGEKRFEVSLESEDYAYISGHSIDGACLFPGIGYLQLVWEVFAGLSDKLYTETNVEFEDVQFVRATRLQKNSKITFVVLVNSGTGHFEVTEDSMAVVTGYIREIPNDEEEIELISVPTGDNTFTLPTSDFYKELRLRGYHYNGLFKSILEARSDGLAGKIQWNNNWVTFIDCVLQLAMLQIDKRCLMLPTGIEKLTIKPRHHFTFQQSQIVDAENEIKYFDIRANKILGLLQCGGVEVKGLNALPISRRYKSGDPILEIHKFVPYLPAPQMNLKNAARFCAQFILENCSKKKITCVEVFDSEKFEPLSSDVKEGFDNTPQIVTDFIILTPKELEIEIPFKNEALSQHKSNMIAIATDYLHDAKLLESLTEQNFEYLLLRESNFDQSTFTPSEHYSLIAIVPIVTGDQTIIILRRILIQKEIQIPTIVKISSQDKKFMWLEPLKNAIKTGPTILYSQNDKLSGILGLVNCISREAPKQSIRYFFIDDVNAPPFDIKSPFYRDQLNLNMTANVYRDGKWGNYRHLLMERQPPKEEPTTGHVYATITKPGDLSSLQWTQGNLTDGQSSKKDLLKIQYTALNFRDVMLATGKIPFEFFPNDGLRTKCPLGMEYCGVTESGDRIMTIISSLQGLTSHAESTNDSLSLKIPDNWTMAEGATVVTVYLTVYIALLVRAKIKNGNSILIHSGTGGVGLAAIRVCLAYGLTVFTTVGSVEKREYLLNNFPKLKPNHIGNSRNLSFEKMVKLGTHGRGVDFVLNSLAGDKLTASIRCLASKGIFLEIGKYDSINNSKIGLREFLREITFHAVHLENIIDLHDQETVKTLMERDIKLGIIQPLPSTIFTANNLQSAFRYLGSGKHIGKVLIKIREHPEDNATLPITVIPTFTCDPDASYIILGGLGGFGLELSHWLIARGAQKLVLSSRTGISKPYQQLRINLWKSYGIQIIITTSNIATRSGCAEIIKDAHQLGPVTAIFNLAVLLHDDPFEDQTTKHFESCFGPKSYATEHFDQLSRALCPRLKHFVVFSSVTTGRGNIHQTNYGMANSIMERIMEQRHSDNLPGIAIQWGAVGDVGIVADLLQDDISVEIGGTVTQGIQSCLEELDRLLFFESPVVSSMVVAKKKSFGANMDIKSVILNILGIRDIKSISMDAKLSELGMDSMTAVEIKQTLESQFDLVLSPQELRVLTFGKLIEYQEKIKQKPGSGETGSNSSNSMFRSLGDYSMINENIVLLKSQNVRNSNSVVIFIPGMESVASPQFRSIAATIKHPVFCLQLWDIKSPDEISAKITEITKNLVTKLAKNVNQVYIVGYSFGSMASLHLAAEFEKLNISTHVLLVEGSPEHTKKMVLSMDEEGKQFGVLENVYKLLITDNDTSFIKQILPGAPFTDRLNKLLQLADSTAQNQDLINIVRQHAENFYNRLVNTEKFNLDTVPRIGSKISLARIQNDMEIDELYGLSAYTTEGAIDVKLFKGDHVTILEQNELVDWIHEYLD